MVAASGTPALADLLNVELTISYIAARQLPSAFAIGRYRHLLPRYE